MDKKYHKEYYEKNKERILENKRINYYAKKGIKIPRESDIVKEYNKLHKEEIEALLEERKKERERVYHFIYFQNNKEKIYNRRRVKNENIKNTNK